MANRPLPQLSFHDAGSACFECGERITQLPHNLPSVENDFDWKVRDFDGYLKFMLDDLIARFPERTRWSPADIEVVLLEILATSLDQLSDMSDRVFGERFLETARRPDSVHQLLSLIGYDAIDVAVGRGEITVPSSASRDQAKQILEQYWHKNPHAMEKARRSGPAAIREQRRMVSLADYVEGLQGHPLVSLAKAEEKWMGSWSSLIISVIAYETEKQLDDVIPQVEVGDTDAKDIARKNALKAAINQFNLDRGLPIPAWDTKPSLRTVLRPFIDAYRLAGQEVILCDATTVGLTLIVSLNIDSNFFVSEVRNQAQIALGRHSGGFFEPGRLNFGEDIYASDIIAHLMQIDGVNNVCIIRFGRTGASSQTVNSRVVLAAMEIAICDNDKTDMSRGYSRIKINGGVAG